MHGGKTGLDLTVRPLTNCCALRRVASNRTIDVQCERQLRLAIGAFYDADRLAGALQEFVLLGLLPDDLWLLTNA